jgi:inosose dehydratase
MEHRPNRRVFSKTVALGLGAASFSQVSAQKPRKLPIGHTGITWMDFGGGGARRSGASQAGAGAARAPRGEAGVSGGPPVDVEQLETIIRDVSNLGFHGVELFGNAVAGMQAHGGLVPLLQKNHNLPLIAIVASPECADPARLKESIQTMVEQGKVAKKDGARIVLMNASGRRGQDYNFNEHKANVAHSLNEAGKAMADLGLQAVLHQHTGTMVEKRDEVYGIMDMLDTRVVKAGFDVGQLSKGGSDPVPIVRDFLSVIEHMHLKDYNGGQYNAGYCPLGQGSVDLVTILDLMESKGTLHGMVMVELDPSRDMPLPAIETAKIAKAYLEKLGYTFRTFAA